MIETLAQKQNKTAKSKFSGARQMAQQVNVLAAKTHDLSSIPRIHMEEKNNLQKDVCSFICVPTDKQM